MSRSVIKVLSGTYRRTAVLAIVAVGLLISSSASFANSAIANAVATFCAPAMTVPNVGSCSACHSTTTNRSVNDLTAAGQEALAGNYAYFCPAAAPTPTPAPTPAPAPAPTPTPTPTPGTPAPPTTGMGMSGGGTTTPTPGMGTGGSMPDDDDDDEEDDDDSASTSSTFSRIFSLFRRGRGD